MIQMTTPDVIFTVDVDLTDAQEISVCFRQDFQNKLLLKKNDLVITSTTITHTFMQEETASFTPNVPVLIQIKALTSEGRVISHEPVQTSVQEIFDRRVFGDE